EEADERPGTLPPPDYQGLAILEALRGDAVEGPVVAGLLGVPEDHDFRRGHGPASVRPELRCENRSWSFSAWLPARKIVRTGWPGGSWWRRGFAGSGHRHRPGVRLTPCATRGGPGACGPAPPPAHAKRSTGRRSRWHAGRS